jgi:hypothetical protein
MADLPYTTLTKIESNVITKPSIQTVAKIAKAWKQKLLLSLLVGYFL